MTLDLPIIDSCDGCGACCREQVSPPMYSYWLHHPELQTSEDEDAIIVRNLSVDLKRELLGYVESRLGATTENDGPCIWLDEESGRCKHYEVRPSICVDFERGSEACHEWRKQFNVKAP